MQNRTHSRKVISWFRAAAIAVCLMGLSGARRTLAATWSVVTDGERTALLTPGPIAGEDKFGWLLTPVTFAGQAVTRGVSWPIARIRHLIDAPEQVHAVRLSQGGWAVVGDVHGGGARLLQVARFDDDLLAAKEPRRLLEADQVEWISSVDVAVADGGAWRASDLFCPRMLEHEGRLYIIGSALRGGETQSGVTWIAEAKVSRHTLEGRLIGPGSDARVVSWNGGFVCAVRDLQSSQTLSGAAPIRLYGSTDLRAWTPMAAPDSELRFHDYDLFVGSGALMLAGVAPHDPPVIRTVKFDAGSQTWLIQAGETAVPSATANVQAISTRSGEASALLLDAADGALMKRPLE